MHQTQVVVSLGPGDDTALRFIRFRRPHSVLLVVPDNLKRFAEAYRKQLACQKCVAVAVSPHDFNAIRRRLRNALQQEKAADVEFCVSAGPLAVRTAALQLAREHGDRATYVTLQDGLRLHDALQPQAAPATVPNTLECYLAARGIKLGSRYLLVGEPYNRVAEYLVAHRKEWNQIITRLRIDPDTSERQAGNRTLSLDRSRLQTTHRRLLGQLEESGIITQVVRTGSGLSFCITEDHWNYINGHWLEVFVFQSLVDLFDDCSCGQHLSGPPREIDFIGLCNGRFVLVSCKTSAQSYHSSHLKELQSLSQQLDEPDCLRLYVTDRFQHNLQSDSTYTEFVAFARAKSIEVVFGDNLTNIREFVSQRLTDHPSP